MHLVSVRAVTSTCRDYIVATLRSTSKSSLMLSPWTFWNAKLMWPLAFFMSLSPVAHIAGLSSKSSSLYSMPKHSNKLSWPVNLICLFLFDLGFNLSMLFRIGFCLLAAASRWVLNLFLPGGMNEIHILLYCSSWCVWCLMIFWCYWLMWKLCISWIVVWVESWQELF